MVKVLSRSSMRANIAALSLSLTAAACGGVTATPAPPTETPTRRPDPNVPQPEPPVLEEVSWGACDIPYGESIYPAECAFVDMPARRDVAGSGTIPVAVYRLKAPKQPAAGQLWMLNGGPGGSGAELAPYGDIFARTFAQGLDVYLVDHRGTGESSFMACPVATRNAATMREFGKQCSAELRETLGDKADGFSTTESAHDVRELIDATVKPGQKVFVYGVSYGSYWTHRLLQLPGLHVDAVVTEGNCLSSTCSFDKPQTFAMAEVMKNILDACKLDEECTARLGSDPWQFAKDTVALLSSGHCSEAAFSAYPPADMFLSVGPIWAQGVLPLLYRLNRCNANDVVMLDRFEKKVAAASGLGIRRRPLLSPRIPSIGTTPKPDDDAMSSAILGMHIIASELLSRPVPTKAQLDAQASSLIFKANTDLEYDAYDAWQTYPRDAYVGGWMKRDVPWLMLQGDFDFQTVYSLSQESLKHVQDPSLQFVRVQSGNHSVVFGDDTCPRDIMQAFLENPTAKVDTSCLAALEKKSTKLDPDYVAYFFGSGTGWD